MGQIQVQTPELAVAAMAIGRLSSEIDAARSAVSSAEGQAGAFGGEPIGEAFANMCSAASSATAQYGDTISQLSRNVLAASYGYVSTDEGVIPVSVLGKEGRNP
jgi:excreted virulence factor EspC (type VII ESX diderm)